jgi:hypothetical protein
MAAQGGHFEVVRLLLGGGADQAALKGHAEVTTRLVPDGCVPMTGTLFELFDR